MRIALVAHVFGFRDGQGRVNYEVACAALDAGIHVTLIAESYEPTLGAPGRARIVHIPQSRLPSRLLKDLSFAVQSGRWLSRHRAEFDVIQVNGFVTFATADIAVAHFVHTAWSQHPSYPYRSRPFHPLDLYQRFYTWFNAWQERRVYRGARRVIAVSRRTARDLQSLGVNAQVLCVLYNGVDVDAYHPGPAERALFALPEHVSMALFVGDLKTPRKNLGLLLQSMQALPDLHLAVAGDTAGSVYPLMARELGIADRVYFVGKTSRVAQLMRSVDLFVFPSLYEAHPLVVMEAMASGLPVIVSNNFAEGEDFAAAAVVLTDARDAAALATCIKHLLRLPTRAREAATAGRAYAMQMSWPQTASRYLAVYADLARENAAAAGSTSTEPSRQ